MRLVEFSVRAPPEFAEPLSQLFRTCGGQDVVIERAGGYNPDEGEEIPHGAWVTVRTYLQEGVGLSQARSGIDVGVRLIAHVGDVGELSEKTIEEAEWREAYKRHLAALKVGRRLIVLPTWEARSHWPGATGHTTGSQASPSAPDTIRPPRCALS